MLIEGTKIRFGTVYSTVPRSYIEGGDGGCSYEL